MLTHLSNPKELWEAVKRKAYLSIYKLITPAPDFIAEKSWDNLIILDACRFDAFALVNRTPGRLTKIVSAGSSTWEWLPKNFLNRKMKDVIYICKSVYFKMILKENVWIYSILQGCRGLEVWME